jgi:hypothetical protein
MKAGSGQQAAGSCKNRSKKKSVFCFSICTLLFALHIPAEAQQPKRVYRIGYLSSGAGIEVREKAFWEALRELGYIEGHNLIIEPKGELPSDPSLLSSSFISTSTALLQRDRAKQQSRNKPLLQFPSS